MTYNELVGKNLNHLRKIRGITVCELADYIGLTVNQIYRYESGVNKMSVDILAQIADYMRVSITEFFVKR